MMDKFQLIISILLEVLIGTDIVITIVKQEVSVSSFVCVAMIAMLQVGVNLLNEHYNRKNRK